MNDTNPNPTELIETTNVEMHIIDLSRGDELILDVIDLGEYDPDNGLGKPNQDLVAFLDGEVAQKPGAYAIKIWSTTITESPNRTTSPTITEFSIESFVGYSYDDGTWQISGDMTIERWKAMFS